MCILQLVSGICIVAEGRASTPLLAVLTHPMCILLLAVLQELHEQGAINSKLQAGITDSLEALGAYIKGLPKAYNQHLKAQAQLQDRPKVSNSQACHSACAAVCMAALRVMVPLTARAVSCTTRTISS